MFKSYSKPNLVYQFKKSPELEVELRFPTSENEVQLNKFLQRQPELLEAIIYEIALIAVRTNIMDEKEKPLFDHSTAFGEKILSIYAMPVEMITELYDAICEFYPDWKLVE